MISLQNWSVSEDGFKMCPSIIYIAKWTRVPYCWYDWCMAIPIVHFTNDCYVLWISDFLHHVHALKFSLHSNLSVSSMMSLSCCPRTLNSIHLITSSYNGNRCNSYWMQVQLMVSTTWSCSFNLSRCMVIGQTGRQIWALATRTLGIWNQKEQGGVWLLEPNRRLPWEKGEAQGYRHTNRWVFLNGDFPRVVSSLIIFRLLSS